MAVTHGKDGSVKVGGTAVASVNTWDATIEPNYDDITSMDSSGWQNLMLGIRKVSGSINVRYDPADTNGQIVLKNNALGGTAVALILYTSGTSAGYMSGSAFLTEAVTVDHNAPNARTFSFQSHGAWTYTT